MLNDQAYVEMALGFAVSILEKTTGQSTTDRMVHAFRRALSRDPTDGETKILLIFYGNRVIGCCPIVPLLKDLLSQAPDIKIPTKLDSNEVGAWFFVANALLNLDETITKG